jgi:5'-nucleotidase
MTDKPRILITNDDGISAPGLIYLYQAVMDFADVSIIAPALEQSGTGLGITIRDPLLIETVKWEKETPAWKVSGTPADCVRMGLSVILKHKPDLIISGINRGANSGRNVLYSGTVGGVIEGVLRGVPGIAFSCCDFMAPSYDKTVGHILSIVQHLLKYPLPKGTLLNVNFPETDVVKGIKMARQGFGYWIEDPEERLHPEGHNYYWMGGKWNEQEEHEESDVALLNAGYAAAVPIHVHEMTDHVFLNEHKATFDRLLN